MAVSRSIVCQINIDTIYSENHKGLCSAVDRALKRV